MPVDGDIILKAGLDSTGVSKQLGSLQKSITKGLKNIIRVGFGVRSVFALIRKLRSALVEGLGNLSQVHEPLNQAMSSIMTSLNLLKNTFAAAFAPLIETVAPILTTFINKMANAVSVVGQFIAALTGKEYVRAGAVYQDYAASLDKSTASSKKSTSATKKQTEAQKKLNREITHFDDLVILHDKEQDDTDTSAPATAAAPAYSFSTAPVDSMISKVVADFKAAWEDADFTFFGRLIGSKLKDALEKIPWDEIKTILSKLGKSIATFLNGVLETPGLFRVIGETIAQGINSAFTFVNSFVRNFHWESLGYAVRDKILATVKNLDWPLIYGTMANLGAGIGRYLQYGLNNPEIWSGIFTTLANAVNAIVVGIQNLVNNVDWASFGTNLGTGLNNGINAFNWDSIATTLILLINSAFSSWYNFVTTFDFAKFGSYIGHTLSKIIKGINWKEGGASVAKTIEGLFNALDGFIVETDWGALGQSVIDVLEGFFAEFDWGTIAQTLSDAVIGLLNALTGAFEEVDWDTLGEKITDAISTFLDEFDWAAMADAAGKLIGAAFKAIVEVGSDLWNTLKQFGKDIINGGFQGIKDRLLTVGTWIKTYILDPFVEGFKTAFGISSPSKEMQPLGEYLIEGLFKGITDTLVNIVDWLKTNIVDPIINGIKSLFGLDGEESILVSVGKDLIAGLKIGMANIISSIGDWLKRTITDPIVNGIIDLFGLNGEESSLVSVGKNLIAGFKAGVGSIMSSISGWLKRTITDPIVNGIKSLFGLDGEESVLVSVGKNLLEGLKEGLLSAVDGIGGWIDENVTGPICGFFKDLFGIASPSTVFSEYGGYLMEGLENGITDNTDKPKEALNTAQSSMKNAFGAFKELVAWGKLGSDIMSLGLKAGIVLMTPTVLTLVENLEKDLREKFSTKNESWKLAGIGLMNYLKLGFNDKRESVISTAQNIIDTAKTTIENYNSSFTAAGATLISKLADGLNAGKSNLERVAGNVAHGMYNEFTAVGFYNVGYNIATGIYNGLFNNRQWLNTLAWNTAVDMYNNACRALRISSPSKKFAWIGEMITQGLGNGILDNEANAVGAVTDMTSAMTDEAEKANPSVSISTSIESWIESLDEVLTRFSDTVINKFDTLINTLGQLSNISANVPAVAQGFVVPSAIRSNNSSDAIVGVTRMLENLSSNQMTPDDLRPLLIEMFSTYMNLTWTIGDEQLAHHVNAGNASLDRRYNMIR